MTLKERLQEDLKTAMKNKESLKLSVIRLAKAAIMNQEIARGHELSDQEVIEVLSKELKQRNDSIPEYEKAGRGDIVNKLKEESLIIQTYLPEQLTETELKNIIEATIADVGATTKKEIGKVMAALMPKIKGRADGKIVNQIVNAALGE